MQLKTAHFVLCNYVISPIDTKCTIFWNPHIKISVSQTNCLKITLSAQCLFSIQLLANMFYHRFSEIMTQKTVQLRSTRFETFRNVLSVTVPTRLCCWQDLTDLVQIVYLFKSGKYINCPMLEFFSRTVLQ